MGKEHWDQMLTEAIKSESYAFALAFRMRYDRIPGKYRVDSVNASQGWGPFIGFTELVRMARGIKKIHDVFESQLCYVVALLQISIVAEDANGQRHFGMPTSYLSNTEESMDPNGMHYILSNLGYKDI